MLRKCLAHFPQNPQIWNWCINCGNPGGCSPAVYHFPRVFLSVYFCFAGQICAHVQFFGNIKANASRLFQKISAIKTEAKIPGSHIVYESLPGRPRGHKGQNSTGTRCRGFLALEPRCRVFLVLESRCRGFLVLESRCRGICASTASFSFSLNLLCHIININMWIVDYANYFVSHKLVF